MHAAPLGGDYWADAPQLPDLPPSAPYIAPAVPPSSGASCTDISDALIEFKSVVSDPGVLASWTGDVCSSAVGLAPWSYVNVSSGRVRALDLAGLGLSGGPIPDSLFTALTDLQVGVLLSFLGNANVYFTSLIF
jgi:hypothetical protein